MTAVGRRSFLGGLGGLGAGGVVAALGAAAPAGAAAAANTFDPASSVYNWKASNTRRHRAALGTAMAGGAACELFVGDSLSAGCTNVYTSHFDRLHAWPLVYRDTLANLGVPANGTGLVRVVDASFVDPRVTWTGPWMNNTTGACVLVAGATVTFTTDKPGSAAAVLYGRYSTSAGFTVSVDGATSGPGFLSVPGGGSGWARAELTGIDGLAAGSTVTVTTTGAGLVLICAFEVYTPSGGLSVHNAAQSGSGATFAGKRGWTATGDLNQNLSIWAGLYGSPYVQRPSAVHIALGNNDVTSGATDDAITAGLTAIRNAFPNADCFLYLEPKGSTISDDRWATFCTAMYALADTLDVPLFDMEDRLGGYSTEATMSTVGDSYGHLSSAGYADWGRGVGLVAGR
jgi:hypothetical protein